MLGSYLGFCIAFIIIFIKNKKLAIVFAFTFVVGALANFALKNIVCRARPFDTYSFIQNYGNEDGFGFPSGHSVCGAMFATFLIYHLKSQVKNKWTRACGGVALSLLTFLIAFSRMVLGVHYLSDTIVGIIFGITVAIIGIYVYTYLDKRKRRK
ncbi:MAG: phosphatase PAP2 family protein [Clostridia bacterium]|nr:phosphatase PAP2 family protein [Clostridia bacterium]